MWQPRQTDLMYLETGTSSVTNYKTFDFFYAITYLIQKFIQNITSFVMACFINKVLQNNLNLAMFVQIFLNKTSGQTWIQKSQTSYKKEWRE